MLELLNSLVRLSAAMTVYGMQEVQTAAGSVHPEKSVEKLREMIDSLADSLSSRIDDKRRPMLDNINRTLDVRSASDRFGDLVRRPAPATTVQATIVEETVVIG
ncbi:MAG TPA: hypothetical protein VHC72_13320 [Bryobacteraceae bacterium]|jgi:hypothetical protein|nr:hypothetical protein [Bryobacteraceae bacterium]